MSVYTACVVKDESGKLHDIDLHTSSSKWGTRLRAVRRWCERNEVTPRWAYIGGNFWGRHDIANA